MTAAPVLVTVCITTYQYGRFVAAAIDSALSQTHPAVEVVVVDDGSTDDTAEVLARYGDRIRVIRQDNAGQGAAVTCAVQQARGEVVLLLDADDLLEPTLAAAAVAAFADPDVVDVQHLGELVDADGHAMGARVPRTAALLGSGDLLPILLRHRCYPWQPTSGHAYRRSALLRVLPIPAQTYVVAADSYLAEVVPLLGRTAVLDQVGFRYRMHGANDSLAAAVDAAYFRARIARIVETHAHVLRVAQELGVPGVHPDVCGPLDPALLSYRLASLRLDPDRQPFDGDRRLALAALGVRAALAHPLLSGRSKLVRTAWFVLVGALPLPAARRIVQRHTPDVPRSTRQLAA